MTECDSQATTRFVSATTTCSRLPILKFSHAPQSSDHRGKISVMEVSLDSPVLDLQTPHPPEFALIVCDQCQPGNHGMRSDPEIVVADHLAF